MKAVHTRSFVFVLALVLVVTSAQARRARRPQLEWGIRGSVSTIYNSNLIGLSAGDRDRFLSSPDSFPTPLKSVDDLENELLIHPTANWRAPLNLMVGADYRFKYIHRLRNSFTDYQTHSLSLSARPRVVGYRWSTRFRALLIPSYYVRVYRDRDYDEYHAARYTNLDYALSARYRWWQSLWTEGGISYGTFYYNQKFTEYDSEARSVSVASGYDFGPSLSVSADYARRISENVGKDQPGVFTTPPADPGQVGDTEYGDADYNEDDWSAQVTARTDRWYSIPLEAALSYRLRRRVYTTDRPIELDPFHRGRLDKRHQITFSITANVLPSLAIEPYVTYDERKSESEVPAVVEVKSFVRREFGLLLEYRFR